MRSARKIGLKFISADTLSQMVLLTVSVAVDGYLSWFHWNTRPSIQVVRVLVLIQVWRLSFNFIVSWLILF